MKTLRSRSLGLFLFLFAPALLAQVPQLLNYQSRVAAGSTNFDGSGLFKFGLAQVPQLLNYQGRVAVGSTNFDGSGSFKFALVNTDGASTYWSNDGTSTAGSEPAAAVTLTVTKGLYSVQLGQNMTAIPNSVFSNPDVRLRVWFNDGVNGSQLLTPDQRIAAVGYAMMAGALQPGTELDANSLRIGSYGFFNGTPKLIKFGDGDFVSIGENSGDNRMELTAANFVFNGGSITAPAFIGNGSGLTNLPSSALTGTIPASQIATPPPGMALIPAGEFTMGNTVAADTEITNAVPISTTVSAFYMDVNEVTLSQWQVVQQWATLVGGYTGLPAGSGKAANHPVHTVSWYDCVKWCNARSEREGKTPVYYTADAQTENDIYRTGNVDVTNMQVNWSANGYRLPTEAEWEKAARGGLAGKRFPWGDTISQKQANYYGLTGSYAYDDGPDGYNAIGNVGGTSPATSSVGSFAANGYGLHDMAGNVFEWCWDRYGTPYAGGTDPHGATTGSLRVIRGGGWFIGAYFCRSAVRFDENPGNAVNYSGVRAVLAPGQ